MNDLGQAIQNQGAQLVRRAEWFQKMIERQAVNIENCQKTMDGFSRELAATNLAIDALRLEYRKHVSEQKEA